MSNDMVLIVLKGLNTYVCWLDNEMYDKPIKALRVSLTLLPCNKVECVI